MISICMLKMPRDAISEPLLTIFENCFKCGEFADEWKKGKLLSLFKKDDN